MTATTSIDSRPLALDGDACVEQPGDERGDETVAMSAQERSAQNAGRQTTGLGHHLLSADDEVMLAVRMEAGLYAAHLLATDKRLGEKVEELEWLAADGQEARRQFIEQNLRLAVSTSRKYRGRGFTEEDLHQDAYQGLVRAVDRFDHTKGFKFSTYAVWWIRESILSGIRSSGFIKHPEALWNQIVKVRGAKMQILDETGDKATPQQIAGVCGLSLREVQKGLRADVPVSSLSTPIGEDLTLGDLFPDDEAELVLGGVEYHHDHDQLAVLVTSLLFELCEPEREVLWVRYGLDGSGPRTLTAAAAELGLNRQTVRTREQRALAELQSCGRLAQLEPYRLLLA